MAVVFAPNVPAKESSKELKFEQVFSAKGEPGVLHYQAVFHAQGVEHHLEAWRDGDKRLKRRTDDAVETYVFRKSADDPEFHMSVLDMKKRIHTRIDRTNLYRIGNFTDWFDLAHGLKRPKGEYRLTRGQAPDGVAAAMAPCQWYELSQDARVTSICWSTQNRLPLLIQAQDGKTMWKVVSMDNQAIAPKTFEIHDEGYVRNDANQDIERD